MTTRGDPCQATGAGWIAEEALATALYCYLISPDEPVAVLGRGAASSGDSDSIACLAGAFAGAALGLAAWPDDWREPDRVRRPAGSRSAPPGTDQKCGPGRIHPGATG